MNQVAENERKIIGALAHLYARKNYSVQMAMEKALKGAMLYAMEMHEDDGVHTQHLEHDEHYGWILLHNGDVVSKSLYKSDGIPGGFVDNILERYADDLPEAPWVGIVVAGMAFNYSEDFEMGVMDIISLEAGVKFPVYFLQFLKRKR